MKIAKALAAIAVLTIGAQPVLAATTLGPKDSARVARADRRDREEVRYCLIEKKKGARKGTIIGAAGGAGVGLVAGGGVGETLLGAGAGALAGNLLGKGTSTNKRCDQVLARNK